MITMLIMRAWLRRRRHKTMPEVKDAWHGENARLEAERRSEADER